MTKKKTIRRAPGSVSPNWNWRDGRPRWIPSPSLRKAGWRGHDLKDKAGAWLGRGASIDAADAINVAVAGWRAGQLVAAAYADICPPGACAKPQLSKAERLDRHSIGRLMDEWTGVTVDGQELVKPWREFAELKPGPQAEYRSKLKRLVDALAGYAVLPGKDDAAGTADYLSAVAKVRGWPVTILEADEDDGEEDTLLEAAYHDLKNTVSLSVANGALRVAGTWLEFVRKRKKALRANPAHDVDQKKLDGRLRPASWPELVALIQAAEAAGYPSIADSIILGVDLSWSQADRLAMTWAQIRDNRVRTRRIKTNRPGETKLLDALGLARLPKIRRRQAALFGGNIQATHVLICETTKKPWGKSHYQTTFAEIRAAAARKVASCAEVLDKDLRATAVGVAYEAGLSPVQIAGRTLHSLDEINDILDNHYGVISRAVGDQAAGLLNAYLAEQGIEL